MLRRMLHTMQQPESSYPTEPEGWAASECWTASSTAAECCSCLQRWSSKASTNGALFRTVPLNSSRSAAPLARRRKAREGSDMVSTRMSKCSRQTSGTVGNGSAGDKRMLSKAGANVSGRRGTASESRRSLLSRTLLASVAVGRRSRHHCPRDLRRVAHSQSVVSGA